MPDIVFARTVYHYDPYDDFFRLAELAGFPIIQMDKLDVSKPGIYITSPMNGDTREHLRSQAGRPRNAHIILWNLERPANIGGGGGTIASYALSNRRLMYGQEDDGQPAPCRYVDEVWVSDRRLAQETSLRYVTLGSHPDLGDVGAVDEMAYNWVHMSAEVPRRQTVFKDLDRRLIGPNSWPPKRDLTLRISKFGLNVHQDNHPFMEPLRFALFAAYGLPIITETLMDAYPYGMDTMIFAPYDKLATTAYKVAEGNYDRWREMGRRCRDLMTKEYEFGKVVREAVGQSTGEWR